MFFKKEKEKEEKVEYSPWLQVNYVFKEYTDEEDNEEIEKIVDEIFAFKIVDLGGPMSLEEEFKYPLPPSLEIIIFPIELPYPIYSK